MDFTIGPPDRQGEDMEKSIYTREYRLFADLLRETRERAGLTQVELAERLKQTQSHISKVERGERRLDIVQLRIHCRAINTTVSELVAEWELQIGSRGR